MSTYRYIFADLLTNKVSVELPLYGTSFTRRICKAGEFNGSIALNMEGIPNRDIIDGTAPGRTAIWVERDNRLVWGGIIWSRTWQEQSKTFQYYGASFESWFDHVVISKSLNYANIDEREIVRSLIMYSEQLYDGASIGLSLPPVFVGGIARTTNFYDYDGWTFGKALQYMAEFDEGLDWYIEPNYDVFGEFTKTVRIDKRLGASLASTGLSFVYPGSIKNFWYPENASRAAVTMFGYGAGEGVKMQRYSATDTAARNRGYPNLSKIYSNKDVKTAATLQSNVTKELQRLAVPVIQPTFEINPSEVPLFGDYQLGDFARMIIESDRFPDGYDGTVRIVGWDVKPSQSESTEQVKLILAGEEE